ncbi:hypothetical protein [Lacihabitans lacunae]|uniref:DUF3300 domain-containing protein n=1 Tax=Lacihabitans lacunae TaxID=1028214 RepID=A0ABV7YWI0_9BACT
MKNINQKSRKAQIRGLWKRSIGGLMVLLVSLLTNTQVFAQKTTTLETEKGISAAIAPYSADVRSYILLASLQPDVLMQLKEEQKQTAESFRNIMNNFDQTEQSRFYTLSRYPDLMELLSSLPKGKSNNEIMAILPSQDQDLQEAAWKIYKNNKSELLEMVNMYSQADIEFQNSIKSLDPDSRMAFQKLAQMPDVLTLLTDNIDLTAKLGEHFIADKNGLTSNLVALHDSLNVQNQYEYTKFKDEVGNNPDAMSELSRAAQDYANQNGYNVSPPNNYNNYTQNMYNNPYSYWFGYPSWYGSPMWYPNSFWYNMGLYSGNGFGLYGFPSYGFANWFFSPSVYVRYPNLYNNFGNYYRNQVHTQRFVSPASSGFMNVAHSHFSPNAPRGLNYLSSASHYSRPINSNVTPYRATSRGDAGGYHGDSWSNFSRESSFNSGAGFRMPSGGGGSRGGGGRH